MSTSLESRIQPPRHRIPRRVALAVIAIAAAAFALWVGSSALTADPAPGSAGAPAAAIAVTNPALRAFVESGDEDRRLPSDLASRLPRVAARDDVAAVVAVMHDRSAPDAVRNEAMNLLRRSAHAGLDDQLLAIADDRSERPRLRAFAVQHLGPALAAQPRLREAARALLDSEATAVRREALLALVRAHDPEALQRVAYGLEDRRLADARDLVIACCYELGWRDRIAAIRPLAYDADEVVRIAAIAALGGWRDLGSRAAFEAAAVAPTPRLRRAGKLALDTLAAAPRS